MVGAEVVAKAPADGYTLLMMGTSVGAINPHTLRRLPYDPLRDFAPIGSIAETPYVLVTPPDAPGADFAGWMRRRAGARPQPGPTAMPAARSWARCWRTWPD